MNSRADACVLVLMISASLQKRLTADFFESTTVMNWFDANVYCNDRNGSLILFNKQNNKNELFPGIRQTTLYWTALRLNSSYPCDSEGIWSYDGWAKWDNTKTREMDVKEPNQCPSEACVVVKHFKMRTESCNGTYAALCRKDVPTTKKSTSSSLVPPHICTTTRTPSTAVVTSYIRTTTPDTYTGVVTSDVSPTTQSTHSAVVTAEVRTTIQSTHSAVVTTDVRTTTQSTSTAVVTSYIRTTTPGTYTDVVTPDDRTTTQSTHSAVATTDISMISTNIGNNTYNNTLVDGNCEECCVKKNKNWQLSHEELKRVVQELKSQLAVNKTNLSAIRRKLISVYDSRPSSVAMGGVAIAILVVFFGIIVIPDMVNLVRCLYKLQKKHLI